jgi:hypothetical protein
MGAQNKVAFQKRIDDYSYQVSTESDPRFWFRLVRESDRDVITDYFIGSFPKEHGGCLLRDCYRVLGLTPRRVVIFGDILSGRKPGDSRALDDARELYAAFGQALFSEFGARIVNESLEKAMGKFNLVLVAEGNF